MCAVDAVLSLQTTICSTALPEVDAELTRRGEVLQQLPSAALEVTKLRRGKRIQNGDWFIVRERSLLPPSRQYPERSYAFLCWFAGLRLVSSDWFGCTQDRRIDRIFYTTKMRSLFDVPGAPTLAAPLHYFIVFT